MISQMNAVWISADQLKTRELNSTSKQSFYNYILGHPYEDTKLAVKENDVYGNLHDKREYLQDLDDYRFISVGIDWGKIILPL